MTFFHLKNLRFSRVLRTRDCLVQSDRQFIHGPLTGDSTGPLTGIVA